MCLRKALVWSPEGTNPETGLIGKENLNPLVDKKGRKSVGPKGLKPE